MTDGPCFLWLGARNCAENDGMAARCLLAWCGLERFPAPEEHFPVRRGS